MRNYFSYIFVPQMIFFIHRIIEIKLRVWYRVSKWVVI